MFNDLDLSPEAVIKVFGVGGAGCNAVNEMIRRNDTSVEYVAINSDAQALKSSSANTVIQIGLETSAGLGCGAEPEQGAKAAIESAEDIKAQLEGVNMLFIAAGMGGGTGTGASPIIADMARQMGILTVAVVTKPFNFEGKKRTSAASAGIHALKQHVDSLIVVENSKLITMLPKGTTLIDSLREADSVLCNAVFSIAELITTTGLMNVDFADVRTVMKCKGRALMGVGEGSGENRAIEAAEQAIECPLLEEFEMNAAKGFLCTITHGLDFGIEEMSIIGEKVQQLASPDAVVVIGTVTDPDMGERCGVTVIATGLEGTDVEPSPTISKINARTSAPDPKVAPTVASRPEVSKPQLATKVHTTQENVSPVNQYSPTQENNSRVEPTINEEKRVQSKNNHLSISNPLARFNLTES